MLLPAVFSLCIFFPAVLTGQQTKKQSVGPNRVRIAQDYERRGHYDAALKIYRDLYEAVPKNQLYYEGVKRNMLRLKRFDELGELVRAQIRLTDGIKYHADLGEVLYQQGEHEAALQQWRDLLQRFAAQKAAYTYAANAMIANRLYEEAVEVYLSGRKQFDSDDVFVFELANIYAMRLKFSEATREYLKQLEKNPNQFSYVESRLINYTKDREQAEQVAGVLREYLSQKKNHFLGRKLLANLYLRMEDFRHALQEFMLLEELEPPNKNRKEIAGQYLFFFAEKALNARQFQFAQEAYQLILTKHSDSPYRSRAMFGIGMAEQQQGRPAEALKHFDDLLQTRETGAWAEEALFRIGEIYFNDFFNVDKALEVFNRLVKTYPHGKKTTEAYFRIADCHAARSDFETAETWYGRGVATLPQDSRLRDQGIFRIAYLQFLHADYDSALTSLAKITAKLQQPGADQSFVNDALELTFLIEENRTESPEALASYVEAQKLRMQREDGAALALLEQITTVHPQAPIIDETLLLMGEMESQRGNHLAAIGHFRSLLLEHGDSIYNALVQKRIAEIYELGLADLDSAFEEYENVLINYPASLYVEEVRQKLRDLQTRRLNN